MIEIVKAGKLPGDIEMHGVCINCGCGIKCKKSDAKAVSGRYNETLFQVKCPTQCCTSYIYVEKSS